MRLQSPIALVSVGLLAVASAAHATTYTVGQDGACDYSRLRPALLAAASQPGDHFIKISRAYDNSLAYTWGNPDSAVVLDNPVADSILIAGAYEYCFSQYPNYSETTTLGRINTVDDVNRSLLRVNNNDWEPFQLKLRDITMEGKADITNQDGPLYGGGLRVDGNVKVILKSNSVIRNFRAREGGGGVAMISWYGYDPTLELRYGAGVSDNIVEKNGGGIYAGDGKIIMLEGHVDGNVAETGDGGGIWISGDPDPGSIATNPEYVDLLVKGSEFKGGGGLLTSVVEDNTAAGKGGGIYSEQAWIQVTPTEVHIIGYGGHTEAALTVRNNEATLGGGLFIEGPQQDMGGPFTDMILIDTQFRLNTAHEKGAAMYILDAVDGEMDSAAMPCEHSDELVPCSMVYLNAASGNGYGSAIYMTDERGDGMSRPRMRFERTLFHSNLELSGRISVATAWSYAEFSFNRCIFDNNAADGGSSALIYSSGRNVDFRYNSVLENDTDRAFAVYNGDLDLQGSYIWMPGHELWWHFNGDALVYKGCLATHLNSQVSAPLWIDAPRLGANYAPKGGSALLDFCDSLDYSPITDVSHQNVHDVAGVGNWYQRTAPAARDLGAVEQVDIIYANNFGYRLED